MDKKIVWDMKKNYDVEVRSFSRIDGGFMNKLWCAETDAGVVLVKVFSNQRFYGKKLDDIEAAIYMQDTLYSAGVCCPRVYASSDGFLRRMDDGTAYMVMEFCRGKNETAETITTSQLRSFGRQCACMHKAFDCLPYEGGAERLINCAAEAEKLKSHMAQWGNEQMQQIAALWTENAIAAQKTALRHEDMTQDNVLFDDEGVVAIIDFDRSRYGFALHDVGRAILSFSLDDNGLNIENLLAFAAGYREILSLSCEDIIQALRLTWFCEASWWIGPKAEKLTGKALRFRKDILWLTYNYFALTAMIDALQTKGL